MLVFPHHARCNAILTHFVVIRNGEFIARDAHLRADTCLVQFVLYIQYKYEYTETHHDYIYIYHLIVRKYVENEGI